MIMKPILSNEAMERAARKHLKRLLSGSGLLEYGCQNPNCQTVVFSIWEVDLTCNGCGNSVNGKYWLEQGWKRR